MRIYFIALLISAVSFGQIKYEKGYFIDNQNVRTECLIRAIDWKDTPSSFDYKLSEDAPSETKKDYQVSEFGFGDVKFIGVTADIDQSPDWTDRLSIKREPEYENRRVFLKVLVDGKFKLYRYDKNEMVRFFFRDTDGPIKPLIYKRYFTDNTKLTTAKNTSFKQQLAKDVNCAGGELRATDKLSYTNSSLIDYFEAANVCNGGQSQVKEEKTESRGKFNLKGSVFFGQHQFGFTNPNLPSHTFKSKPYVSFGAEAEYVLPYWNNKWSIIAEASFNNYNQDEVSNGNNFEIEFGYILVSAGFRHYFYLDKHSRIFLNASMNYEAIKSNSIIKHSDEEHVYPSYDLAGNSVVPSFGIGYVYDRISVEFRADLPGNPSPYAHIGYKYNNVKLIARFRFL